MNSRSQPAEGEDTRIAGQGASSLAHEPLAHVEPPAYVQELNRVADMIAAVEHLLDTISASGVVIPLALLEGYERTLVHAHARNLLRLEELRDELEEHDAEATTADL